jgi:hypothetical protein
VRNSEHFAFRPENYFLLGANASQAKAVNRNAGYDFASSLLPDSVNQRKFPAGFSD